MRTALRRFRRLVGFVLIALAGWAVVRRRSAPVRWIEAPAPPAEPGGPGELPADVLATDAGLTELPAASAGPAVPGETPDGFAGTPVHEPDGGSMDEEAGEAPAGVVVVDEDLVAELLVESPVEPVVAEPDVAEQAGAGPAVAEPAVAEPVAAEPAVAEPVAAEPVVEEPVVPEPVAAEPVVELGMDEPTDTQLAAPELGIDEATMTIARPDVAGDDEETSTRIPMPTFSEAPTMEIPAVTDDLRAVRGIGPSMERMLHGLGIISYRQLAMLDGGELERVRAELSDFRTRIERENWVGQARQLYREKYGRDAS